jgi:hypothetical protein
MKTIPIKSSNAVCTNIAGNVSSVILLNTNPKRCGVIAHNDSTGTLYIKYGETASDTSYTYKIVSGSTWEMSPAYFTGRIDGIWSIADGYVRITELS